MNLNNKLFHIVVIFLSVLFIFVGNRVASAGLDLGFTNNALEYGGQSFYSARIIRIVNRTEVDSFGFINTRIVFDAQITSGVKRGYEVTATQLLSNFFIIEEPYVQAGNRVLLVYDDFNEEYFFTDFVRIDSVVALGAVFLALVILFGRTKGVNAIVALILTCLAVFLVFIPAILAGRNIYAATIIVCLFSIISTLLIVIGPNKKSMSAIFGCLGGVILAGILMIIINPILTLTGVVDHESQALLMLPTQNPINLQAIIFAGVILGAVGAIMDVAMTIASSLWEVFEVGTEADFRSLVKSGINIGRDVLGTMLNTLILAYIGSSLSLLLVIVTTTPSYMQLFNMELITIELMRALVGAFGMFLTIPLTAIICGVLYVRGGSPSQTPKAKLRGSKRLQH